MFSPRSFVVGTIWTAVQFGLGFLFLFFSSKYLLGADVSSFIAAFDFIRQTLAGNAQMLNNKALIFLTSQAFWKAMLTIGVLIVWWLNIMFQERKEYRRLE